MKVRSRDFSGNVSAYSSSVDVTPYRVDPLIFSAPGVFDDGSPMYCYVKVPSDVTSILNVSLTLAFREFFAQATAASSGGASTSGSSSSSSSGASSGHTHNFAVDGGAGTVTGATRLFATLSSTGPTSFDAHVADSGTGQVWKTGSETSSHTHGMAHTHSTPAHTHGLTYGTYEESYPASHSVTVKTTNASVAWTLQDTQAGITADLADLDLTGVITGPGDWRIQVQSATGQPNSGRLGCDLYGSILAIIGGSGVIDATVDATATYINGALWVGGSRSSTTQANSWSRHFPEALLGETSRDPTRTRPLLMTATLIQRPVSLASTHQARLLPHRLRLRRHPNHWIRNSRLWLVARQPPTNCRTSPEAGLPPWQTCPPQRAGH